MEGGFIVKITRKLNFRVCYVLLIVHLDTSML